MTIETSTAKSGPYAGAGLTGPFGISFRFLDNAHLSVVRSSAAGAETQLALNIDFVATGAGSPVGGSLVLTTALAAGETLTIQRSVPITQLLDYAQSDSFPAESHEQGLDKLTMIAQQLNDGIAGAIRVPESVNALPALPAALQRAGTALVFDALGNPVVAAALPAGTQFQYGVPFNIQLTTVGGTSYDIGVNPGLQGNTKVFLGGVKQRVGVDYTWTTGTTFQSSSVWPVGVTVDVDITQSLPTGTSNAGTTVFDYSVAYTAGTVGRWLKDLATSAGASFLGWIQAGAGAVARTVTDKLRERVSVFDFMSAAQIADVQARTAALDVTAPLAAAIASLSGGGVLYFPTGLYRITSALALNSGLTLTGNTNVDRYYGTKTGNEKAALIFQATAATPVFTVGSGVCDLTIEKIAISSLGSPVAYSAPVAGKYGIKFEGSRPNSSYRVTLREVAFYNFERALSVVGVDTGAGVDWQIDDVLVERCTFWNNTVGAYFNTTNADAWKFLNCVWSVWTNGKAIHCVRSGYMELDSCYAVPAEATPGVLAVGNEFVRLGDYPDSIRLVNCQSESLDYFLHVDTSTGYENVYQQIQLIGCIVECPILVERQCKIVSVSSRYTFDALCSGADIEVHSFADSWSPTTKKFVMSGLRPRLFVDPGSTQNSGSVAGVLTATATTLFALPVSAGMYQVYVYKVGGGALYMSTARIGHDGTSLVRLGGDNGANLTITVSGNNVQATQVSGVTQTLTYAYHRIA